MAFRFVHTADIHLDSPLRSLALRHAELAELIGNATRRAFTRIIDLCLEEQVDALLIAGDLYDGDQKSMRTARFLAEQLRRLDAAKIRTFIIRGNHDAMSNITQELVFPDSVKVFGGRAESVEIERATGDAPVFIHGLSFAERHAPESLLRKYRPAIAGAINIGLLHTSLAGAPGHDNYAPCSLTDLQATGFHYWALGHVHQRAVVEARGAIVMPGMPQGRDINEAGLKSVTLVTISDDGSVSISERPTAIAQFERVSCDVSTIDDWRALVATIGQSLDRARRNAPAEHLVVRLSLHGATPLSWRIRRDADLLKAEADMHGGAIGNLWVEKLDIACHAPDDTTAPASDALSELRRIIDENILNSDAFRAELAALADELARQMPLECRDVFGGDIASVQAHTAALAEEGIETVLAHLRDGGE